MAEAGGDFLLLFEVFSLEYCILLKKKKGKNKVYPYMLFCIHFINVSNINS